MLKMHNEIVTIKLLTSDDLHKSYYEEVDGSMQEIEIFTSGKTV